MSNTVSALNTASWALGDMSVTEMGLQGMITIRADLEGATVKKAVTSATGAALPDVRGMTKGKQGSVAWMSPDELLVLCAYDSAGPMAAQLVASLSDTHALVTGVSDARAMFKISGPLTREALAKLAPVDMSPDGLSQGEVRRTRLAQVPAALWVEGDDVFVVCFRSVAQYVFDILTTAANPNSAVFSC